MGLKFWAGDSERASVRRSQDDSEIKCSDKQFDEFGCLTYSDIQTIKRTLMRCKQWDSSVEPMDFHEAMNLLQSVEGLRR